MKQLRGALLALITLFSAGLLLGACSKDNDIPDEAQTKANIVGTWQPARFEGFAVADSADTIGYDTVAFIQTDTDSFAVVYKEMDLKRGDFPRIKFNGDATFQLFHYNTFDQTWTVQEQPGAYRIKNNQITLSFAEEDIDSVSVQEFDKSTMKARYFFQGDSLFPCTMTFYKVN